MNTKKNQELDLLRAISALAVIVIHIAANFTRIKKFNYLQLTMGFVDFFSAFAVPCFVFISGLVLYKNYNVLEEKSFSFYKKRFSKILPTYIIFSIFYLVIVQLDQLMTENDLNIDFGTVLFKLFTGGAYYHLWYFCILFQFYLFYPVLLKLFKKFNLNFVLFTLFIQVVWEYGGVEFLGYMGRVFGYEIFTFPIMLSHIFWFVFGFYFIENKDKVLSVINIRIGIIMIVVLNIIRILPLYNGLQKFEYQMIPASYFNVSRPIEFFFILLEILVFYKISLVLIEKKNKVTDVLKEIGDCSLEIYLLHPFVIILLNRLLDRFSISYDTVIYYPIMIAGAVVITFLLALFYRDIKNRLQKVNVIAIKQNS